MLRNSNTSISNPKLASHRSKTKSATLAKSIIELTSLLHSIRVILRFFPVTTVTGPLMSVNGDLVNSRIRLLITVLFPTFGGPTTTTRIGGGSRGFRSTSGICCFLVSTSCLCLNLLSAFTAELKAKAFGFLCSWSFGSSRFFFFRSALRPKRPMW